MALTATSRFEGNIEVVHSRGGIYGINFQVAGEGRRQMDFFGDIGSTLPPKSHYTYYNDLVILQQIYATDAGFLDADGDEIIPTVVGFPFGTAIGDLEKHNHWNPLDSTSWARFENQRQANSPVLRKKATYTENADGTIDYVTDATIKNQPSTPTSDNTDFPLADVEIRQEGTDGIVFTHRFDGEDELSLDDLDDQPQLIAFAAWLESIRVDGSGSAVGTDFNQGATFSNRDYSFVQGTGQNAMVMRFQTFGTTVNHVGDVVRIYYEFQRQSGASVAITSIVTLFETLNPSIPTTDNLHKPDFGNTEIPVKGLELELPHGQKISVKDGTLEKVVRKDGQLKRSWILPSTGESVDFISIVAESGIKYIPPIKEYDTVHFEPTSNIQETIRFRGLGDTVEHPGTHSLHSIHHKGTQGTLEIEDFNGDTMAILRPGQFAQFQATLFDNGNGELVKLHLPTRKLVRSAGATGNLTDGLSLHDADADTRYRGFPFPVNPDYVDVDGFNISTTAPPTATQDFTTYTSYSQRDFWRVDWPGTMEIDFTCVLQVGSSNAIPNNHGIMIIQQTSAGLVATEGKRTTVPELTTADGRTSYSIRDVLEVDANNGFMIVFVYPESASVTWSQIFIRNVQLTVRFEPDIFVAYTA